MSETTIVFPAHATSSPGYDRFGTIPTASDLKKIYLWGCKLTNSQGIEIPDEVIEHHIVEAISFIEHTLNLTITPTTYTENQDFRNNEYNSWCLLNLNHAPIIDVASVGVKFVSSQTLISFPQEWMRIYNLSGQIQLTPTSGTLGSWSMSLGGVMIMPGGFLARNDFPQLFEIVYRAGFEQDRVPLMIVSLISRWACLQMLAMLGNLIIGAGIAGYSIGLDGVSQAVSKIPDPYMVLSQQMMTAFNAELACAKTYYNRIGLQVA